MRKLSSSSSSSAGEAHDSGFEEDSEEDVKKKRETLALLPPHQAVHSHNHPKNQEYSRGESSAVDEDGSTSAGPYHKRVRITETVIDTSEVMDDEAEREFRKSVINSVPRPIPIITAQYSLKPDMLFGWKPDINNVHGAPIPLHFDYETFDSNLPLNPYTQEEFQVTYYGPRFKDSLEMHKQFANKAIGDGEQSYRFKFPPNMNVMDALQLGTKRKSDDSRQFNGMNKIIEESETHTIDTDTFKKPSLIFDSNFECGNLDTVVQIKDMEYDLYMRVDSNTRGHHQWFFFTANNTYGVKGRVKFNIVNFTKNASLYHQGMRINVFSQKDYEQRMAKQQQQSQTKGNDQEHLTLGNEGWLKGGENITYKLSKISQPRYIPGVGYSYPANKRYFQVSFEYDFLHDNDTVTFAYSVPYTFTKLQNFLKSVMKSHCEQVKPVSTQYVKESILCKSLSGLEVPVLTVSSRVHQRTFEVIDESEFSSSDQVPLNKFKKYIIVCSRVHPGETNASFVMQGFIKFITSLHPEAIELRKRIVFKIIPMTNPDGVVVGNYRTSLSGSDLNRQFVSPNIKLHPTVCAIKALVSEIIRNAKEPEPLSSFIDIHGHSRKKSIFIYGPHFPLHNERYLKMRVLPKLLSERTDMFRFYSCKFRIQKSKLKAARVVLWKEFGIMNCFTLEASFHGYIDKERQTIELTTEMLENMGQVLGSGFYEYQTLIEEDEKQRLVLKQQIKNKKKKMKAKDIAQACANKQEQQIIELTKQQSSNAKGNLENFFSSSEIEDSGKKGDSPMKKKSQTRKNSSQILPSQSLPQSEVMQKIAEVNRSSAEHTPSPRRHDEDKKKYVEQHSHSTQKKQEVIQPSLKQNSQQKKGFRIKMMKNATATSLSVNRVSVKQGSGVPTVVYNQIPTSASIKGTKSEANLHKRTLKEIYKLLKRDVKQMTAPQVETHTGNYTSHQTNQNNSKNYQSCSSESSDSDGQDSCDGPDKEEGDPDYDDLTPSELQELQNDIIKAIENFDMLYNNQKGKSTDKKRKQSEAKQQDSMLKKLSSQIQEVIKPTSSQSESIKRTVNQYENSRQTLGRLQNAQILSQQSSMIQNLVGGGYGGQTPQFQGSNMKQKRQSSSSLNPNDLIGVPSSMFITRALQLNNRKKDEAPQSSKYILQFNNSQNKPFGSTAIGDQGFLNGQHNSMMVIMPVGSAAASNSNNSLLVSGIMFPTKNQGSGNTSVTSQQRARGSAIKFASILPSQSQYGQQNIDTSKGDTQLGSLPGSLTGVIRSGKSQARNILKIKGISAEGSSSPFQPQIQPLKQVIASGQGLVQSKSQERCHTTNGLKSSLVNGYSMHTYDQHKSAMMRMIEQQQNQQLQDINSSELIDDYDKIVPSKLNQSMNYQNNTLILAELGSASKSSRVVAQDKKHQQAINQGGAAYQYQMRGYTDVVPHAKISGLQNVKTPPSNSMRDLDQGFSLPQVFSNQDLGGGNYMLNSNGAALLNSYNFTNLQKPINYQRAPFAKEIGFLIDEEINQGAPQKDNYKRQGAESSKDLHKGQQLRLVNDQRDIQFFCGDRITGKRDSAQSLKRKQQIASTNVKQMLAQKIIVQQSQKFGTPQIIGNSILLDSSKMNVIPMKSFTSPYAENKVLSNNFTCSSNQLQSRQRAFSSLGVSEEERNATPITSQLTTLQQKNIEIQNQRRTSVDTSMITQGKTSSIPMHNNGTFINGRRLVNRQSEIMKGSKSAARPPKANKDEGQYFEQTQLAEMVTDSRLSSVMSPNYSKSNQPSKKHLRKP